MWIQATCCHPEKKNVEGEKTFDFCNMRMTAGLAIQRCCCYCNFWRKKNCLGKYIIYFGLIYMYVYLLTIGKMLIAGFYSHQVAFTCFFFFVVRILLERTSLKLWSQFQQNLPQIFLRWHARFLLSILKKKLYDC